MYHLSFSVLSLDKMVFVPVTASAAKEAMLPYFPQIVEHIKVKINTIHSVILLLSNKVASSLKLPSNV